MTAVNKDALRQGVIRVLAEFSNIDAGRIKASDRLIEDLGLDSLKRMEALGRVADDYGVDPDLEKTMAMRTVSDVLSLLDAHVAAPDPVPAPGSACVCSIGAPRTRPE